MHPFSFLFLLFVPDQLSPLPTVSEIEKNVLQYRRSIRRGHMVFSQKYYMGVKDEPLNSRTSMFWFDVNKFRSDVVRRYSTGELPVRELNCRNCEREGYVVSYLDTNLKKGKMALAMEKEKDARTINPRWFIDPLLLGMITDTVPCFANDYHLESFVGKADRQPPIVKHTKWKGTSCWQIDYSDLKGTHYRYFVDPNRGPSVIRLEASWDDQGHHFVDAVEIELRQFGSGKIWFPQSCVFQRDMDGKREEKESVAVEVISLNEPIAPEVFKLIGMNIPPGTYITGLPERDLWWNGKEIVQEVVPQRHQHLSNPTIRRWVLIVNAVFFALLAGVLIWRYYKRRQPTA